MHGATKTASCHHDSFAWADGLLQTDKHQNTCRQLGWRGQWLVMGWWWLSTPALQHVR